MLTDDEAVIGAERVVVAALADLEPLHLVALSVLRGVPERVTAEERAEGNPAALGWSPEDLAAVLPPARQVSGAVLATLVRHGLVRDAGIGTYGGRTRFVTTDFAVLCLERLTPVDGGLTAAEAGSGPADR